MPFNQLVPGADKGRDIEKLPQVTDKLLNVCTMLWCSEAVKEHSLLQRGQRIDILGTITRRWHVRHPEGIPVKK